MQGLFQNCVSEIGLSIEFQTCLSNCLSVGHFYIRHSFLASTLWIFGPANSLLRRYPAHYRLFFFFFFLWPHPQHMEVPRLGVELELQLLACITATATPDLSHIWDLHHSSRQCQILNTLSEVRDQPSTSCFLVGFISAVPQRELHRFLF